MNRSGNERYQETDRLLKDTFVKLLQTREPGQITVSELCRETGINRSSFYLHFTDVFDLMSQLEQQLSVQCGLLFASEKDGSYDLKSRFVRLFAFIREHQDFYRAYLNEGGRVHFVEGIIPDSLRASYTSRLEEMRYTSERTLAYHQSFFRAGLTELVRLWLMNGCIETPEDLSDILSDEYRQRL